MYIGGQQVQGGLFQLENVINVVKLIRICQRHWGVIKIVKRRECIKIKKAKRVLYANIVQQVGINQVTAEHLVRNVQKVFLDQLLQVRRVRYVQMAFIKMKKNK